MKLIKLTAIAAAVLGSTAAMAANSTAANYNVQPAYQYNPNAGIINNTTGAIAGTGRTLFNTVTHPGAISAEIGTLGYGANLAWGINDSTELQAGWSGMEFDDKIELNFNDSWINYEKVLGDGYDNFKGNFEYDVDFSNPYLGVQMRPMKNWLTVGAGVMVPRNSLKTTLTPEKGQGQISIDGTDYTLPNGTSLSVEVKNKNKLAPYATLGFRPNINNKWGAFAEVGAAYLGDVKAQANVNGNRAAFNAANPGINKTISDFENDVEKEIADVDSIWYPIAKVGVTYRF